MDHEQPPTNQTTNATQMERAPSHVTSYKINNSSITYTLNLIRQLEQLPRQNINDSFADQIFNGISFY
ncbi:hypothetical protein RCL_jg6602.t1 [Rhizophagus clarus]|uniref:Uncharacterized protein n=1 Tax=Rhizophagus clarus TaxID=94130 RepID=A0A8H3LC38_9GLOM|nr:hypothetical protein RCL_jg6602.t1 [Rhizophagus clarus]